MRVTVHWNVDEWPTMPDGIKFTSQISLMNAQNFVDRRCIIGKITMKPGVIPAHYRKLRDEAFERLAKGRT